MYRPPTVDLMRLEIEKLNQEETSMSDEQAVQSKKWYLSKTLWTNFILGVLVVADPGLKDKLSPDNIAIMFSIVNMLLRLISKDKLELM